MHQHGPNGPAALESTALKQVIISNPQFSSLAATAMGQANVADYCGLLLHLPNLPAPGSLVKLPASVLSAVPAGIAC